MTHNTHLKITSTGMLGDHTLHLQTADTLFTMHDIFRGAHEFLHRLENEVRPPAAASILSKATGDIPTYFVREDTLAGEKHVAHLASPEPHVVAERLHEALSRVMHEFGYVAPFDHSTVIGYREIPELKPWRHLSPHHRTVLEHVGTQFLRDLLPLVEVENAD